jgi:acyl-CoA reductase-like NAD-dependent aldehyde dehydrogenase
MVNLVTGRDSIVGSALAEQMDVHRITFTGSTAVGRSALTAAGGEVGASPRLFAEPLALCREAKAPLVSPRE